MNRFLTKWALAAILGVAGWAASAGHAKAQFVPPFGGGFQPGVAPFAGSGYSPFTIGSYSFFNPYTRSVASYQYPAYQANYAYSYFNPYLGRVENFNLNYAVPYNPYGGGGYGGGGGYAMPYARPGYGGTTSGGYATSANPITNQQLRQLRAASYQNSYQSGGYGDTRSVMSPRWTTAATDKASGKPADVNEALLKASEADVLTARPLNALAIEIRKLEEKGAKADAPLLPAEVLARVAYEGSGAGLLTAVRSGKPGFPRPLTGPQFADLRANVEQHFVAAVEPVAQGKATDAAADRLADAALKAKADPALRHLSDGDATAANKFLDGLVEIAKQIKDPSLAGIAPKWGPAGATASELVRHMGRHRLFFAPAPAGSEEAYGALHRGLSGYYVALARAKK